VKVLGVVGSAARQWRRRTPKGLELCRRVIFYEHSVGGFVDKKTIWQKVKDALLMPFGALAASVALLLFWRRTRK
jgi:hypothetical protein